MGVAPLYADDDDYDPTNPADPSDVYKFRVTVTADPPGNVSGAGSYTQGTTVTISTTAANQYYTFNHWEKDGEYYSADKSFRFTVTDHTRFVAYYDYDYNPANPSDPSQVYQYKLTLTSTDPAACTFSSGSTFRATAGTSVTVKCTPCNGYTFLGWYFEETLLSTSTTYTYTMPAEDVTLTAHFSDFDPSSPTDPEQDEDVMPDDVQNYLLGDVNGDGKVNITDIVALLSVINGETEGYDLVAADANQDSKINITDRLAIMEIINNNSK